MSNSIHDILKKLQNLEQPKSNLTESKASKPDFLDVDKDGDKKEPMKKAAKEKKLGQLAEAIARVEARLMEAWRKSNEAEESGDRPYVCVHAKKGKCEVRASSSYGAAKKAAEKWKLKTTAGIDAYLADTEHDTAKLGEGFEDLQKYMKDKSEKTQHGTKTKTASGLKHERDYDKEEDEKETGDEKRGRGRPKKDKFAEGWDDMKSYLDKKKEPSAKGASGKVAGKRYGGSAQTDDSEDSSVQSDEKRGRGRPKKDKFSE